MRVDVEAAVIAAICGAGIRAGADVPARRPARFCTVELTGRSVSGSGYIETAAVAVQSWAATRHEASELADEAEDAVLGMDEPWLMAVERDTLYYFASEDGLPRYQATYELTVCK